MEKNFKLNQLFVALMVIGCSFGFVSCDDDDDKIPVEPNTKNAWGEFKGKMQILPLAPEQTLADEAPETTDVAATVKNDTVYFNNFPIKDLVATLVSEDQVDKIVEAIGEVKYKVGYVAALNEAKDSIYMTYDPKPLELKVPLGEDATIAVKVKVSATQKGSYELSSKNYKFEIKADEVTVNDGPFDKFPVSLVKFEMKKDK